MMMRFVCSNKPRAVTPRGKRGAGQWWARDVFHALADLPEKRTLCGLKAVGDWLVLDVVESAARADVNLCERCKAAIEREGL